jgi:insecticidal toxin complex protein TccC
LHFLFFFGDCSTWQQTLTIHPNSNRGAENNNQNNFDGNGNLLHLDNIANLDWYYNNTLNKLTKADKPNTTRCCLYHGCESVGSILKY